MTGAFCLKMLFRNKIKHSFLGTFLLMHVQLKMYSINHINRSHIKIPNYIFEKTNVKIKEIKKRVRHIHILSAGHPLISYFVPQRHCRVMHLIVSCQHTILVFLSLWPFLTSKLTSRGDVNAEVSCTCIDQSDEVITGEVERP